MDIPSYFNQCWFLNNVYKLYLPVNMQTWLVKQKNDWQLPVISHYLQPWRNIADTSRQNIAYIDKCYEIDLLRLIWISSISFINSFNKAGQFLLMLRRKETLLKKVLVSFQHSIRDFTHYKCGYIWFLFDKFMHLLSWERTERFLVNDLYLFNKLTTTPCRPGSE